MAESVTTRFAKAQLDQLSERELRALVVALVNGIQALAAKLDSDATVTDVDYAAVFATYVTD